MASSVHKISNYVPEPSLLKERLLVDVAALSDGERSLLSWTTKVKESVRVVKGAVLEVQNGLRQYFEFLTSTDPDERWLSLSDDLPEIQFVCSEFLKHFDIGLKTFENQILAMRRLVRRERNALARTSMANVLSGMLELVTLSKHTIVELEKIQLKTVEIVESERRRPVYRSRPSADFSADDAIERIRTQTTKAREYLAR